MASSSPQSDNLQWFEYRVRAYPHTTDYGGIVWHGSYIAWMEEARIEFLRSRGTEFADLVDSGCDLPVIDLNIHYHKAILHGAEVIIKTRMTRGKGLRLQWDYRLESSTDTVLYTTAQITLIAIDRASRKILRTLPPFLEDALNYFAISENTP